MKLVPSCPPGRSTRKALQFAADIRQLRELGYTYEAIRAALASAGVQVSNRTVQREAARPIKQPTTSKLDAHSSHAADASEPARPEPHPLLPESSQSSTLAAPRISANGPSGKDVAEAFRQRQSTNPLVRAKEQR